MSKTTIQWSDYSWSPLRVKVRADAADIARAKGYSSLIQIAERMAGHVGPHCEHVSDGCMCCYSDTNNLRCLPANGTGLPFDRRSRDLVEPFVDQRILEQPLHWKRPRKIFVENQSDLFGEWNTDEDIDRVFAVMALCPQHSFQCLTKRPERMLRYFSENHGHEARRRVQDEIQPPGTRRNYEAATRLYDEWPLRHVWLGVSVEDQATADERTEYLRRTPAATRFISQEPQLAAIDWKPGMLDGISWLIIGGESGPGARPFEIAWARNTIAQCKAAGVAAFCKQLGAEPCYRNAIEGLGFDSEALELHPNDERFFLKLRDRKGGDMEHWPEDLRVREYPQTP